MFAGFVASWLVMTDRFLQFDARHAAPYDAVIVGGGPAGLSAALVLGRARKRVVVLDDDRPANAVSQGVGGLLGQDRVKPADLRDSGQRQLREYANVEFRHGAVEDVAADAGTCSSSRRREGPPVRAHAIVLAHGLRYEPPPVPGIEALWGRSVFHCAFCDGWEVRDRPLAFHGSGPGAVRSALVLAAWTNDVVLCTDGAPDPAARCSRPRACGSGPSRSPGSPGAAAGSSGSSSPTDRPSGARPCSSTPRGTSRTGWPPRSAAS